jgi:ribose 5-phosphate isomerase A
LRADVATDVEREKRLAAEAAAAYVEDGMRVGLGTGSTATCFLEALAARGLDLRCVATSPATESGAIALGLRVEPFDGPHTLTRLDFAADGADQVSPGGWVVKGGGGAHTREKIVAAAADRFVVMISSTKLVERVSAPIPLELSEFGLAATVTRLGHATLRGESGPTPDGGVLADWFGDVGDPRTLAEHLSTTPGVVEHGLFPPELVSEVLVGRGGTVEQIRIGT